MGPRYEYFKAYHSDPINVERRRSRDAKQRMKRRIEILEILGGKCVICGFSDIRALQLDHIMGGGYKERKKFGSSHNMSIFYLNNPDIVKKDIQLLCANCNWIKAYINKEFKPRRYK